MNKSKATVDTVQEGVWKSPLADACMHRCMLQVRHLMEDFWKNAHLASGYQLLYTPHIAKVRCVLDRTR